MPSGINHPALLMPNKGAIENVGIDVEKVNNCSNWVKDLFLILTFNLTEGKPHPFVNQ